MKDQNFFRLMGLLQLFIGFINFYVAGSALKEGSVLAISLAALCCLAAVVSTVAAAKLIGILD